MIVELLKDIFVIKVPLPNNPLKNLNSYFIKGNERNLLIDTGFNIKECYEAIASGLDELNADMKNTDIFLTHLHTDHIGLSTSIASDRTRIFIGETERKILVNFFKPKYWNQIDEKYFSLGMPREELVENENINPAHAYLPSKEGKYIGVQNGFEFDLGYYKFKCLETPGHTPGHMCLYNEEHKILFSGDHIIFDITPNIISWDYEKDYLGLYMDSLTKIKALDIKVTFSAHRKAIGDCHGRIDALICHHEDRIAEVEQILRKGDGVTPYQIASQMTWSIRAKNWVEFPVTQKWFAVGEALAHLEHLRHRGLVNYEKINGRFIYSFVEVNYN